MKLYLVHCGFYDPAVGDGLYELHTNLFVVADSFDAAKAAAKAKAIFKSKRMHVDGMQEISAVDGCRIELVPEAQLHGETILATSRYGARTTPAPQATLFGFLSPLASL